MKFKGINLSVRFTLMVILLLSVFGMGTALVIRSLLSVEQLLEEVSAKHINELTINSSVSREIFDLSSRVRLLEQTFLYDENVLSKEGFNIDEQLQRIRALSNDKSFVVKMDAFIVDFHRFMGNSLTLNRILREVSVIDHRLGGQIDDLDFALSNHAIQKMLQQDVAINAYVDKINLLRETYLSAGKMVGTVRSSISPDTEQVVIIKVLKELHILEILLSNMQDWDENVVQSKREISNTLRLYRAALRKMTANLDQRWGVMSALIESQKSLISYVEETELDVQRSAIGVREELRDDLINMRNRVFLIGLAVLFAGVIIILVMVHKHITLPLRQLKRSFRQIESNQFDESFQLNRKDEWQVIENAFNRMTTRLKHTYNDLEQERSKLNHLAHHDPLTGLANRMLIHKEVESAIQLAEKEHSSFALLYLDIDHFKNVNDSMGHRVGDILLKGVAERLLSITEGLGVVARLGGDEFMILGSKLHSLEQACHLAESVNEALRQPFIIDEESVFVSSSVGLCMYPGDGESVETLVRNADTAMYQSKRNGRDRYTVYQHSMTSEAHEIMSKSNGLKQALLNDELFLVFQPQYMTETNRIYGAEALIRWQHPKEGLLAPAAFLYVAEKTGMIVDIDDWVIEKAFEHLHIWRQQSIVAPDFNLSVNFSGRRLFSDQLLEHLTRLTQRYPDIASHITLELTERDLLISLEQCSKCVDRIKTLGFKIAIDDFGTGYSSLATLKHMPVDVLKLDRSFISELALDHVDHIIIDSILNMASNLKLHVVAEGVETQQQADILKHIGCQSVQGYFYSYPLTEPDFTNHLALKQASGE